MGGWISTRAYKEVAKAKLASYKNTRYFWQRLRGIRKWKNDHKDAGVISEP
jgi:hypothetical protein